MDTLCEFKCRDEVNNTSEIISGELFIDALKDKFVGFFDTNSSSLNIKINKYLNDKKTGSFFKDLLVHFIGGNYNDEAKCSVKYFFRRNDTIPFIDIRVNYENKDYAFVLWIDDNDKLKWSNDNEIIRDIIATFYEEIIKIFDVLENKDYFKDLFIDDIIKTTVNLGDNKKLDVIVNKVGAVIYRFDNCLDNIISDGEMNESDVLRRIYIYVDELEEPFKSIVKEYLKKNNYSNKEFVKKDSN